MTRTETIRSYIRQALISVDKTIRDGDTWETLGPEEQWVLSELERLINHPIIFPCKDKHRPKPCLICNQRRPEVK